MAEPQGQPMKFAALGAETLGAWAELNQRVADDLTRTCASAMEETTRATADIQQAMFEAWRGAQNAAFRWQALWPEMFRDPLAWYQHAVEHGMGVVRESIDAGRRNAETAIQAFDRFQSRSDEAARTLQDAVKDGASKIRDIQSRTETLRAA
jgi:hypothetical protein